MEKLRQAKWRQLLITLVIAVLVFLPMQLLFACDISGKTQNHCCCVEGSDQTCKQTHPCGSTSNSFDHDSEKNRCCDISLDEPDSSLLSSQTQTSIDSLSNKLPSYTFDREAARLHDRVQTSHQVFDFISYPTNQHLTYLYTQRLRL